MLKPKLVRDDEGHVVDHGGEALIGFLVAGN
jgi:hypothetical protein